MWRTCALLSFALLACSSSEERSDVDFVVSETWTLSHSGDAVVLNDGSVKGKTFRIRNDGPGRIKVVIDGEADSPTIAAGLSADVGFHPTIAVSLECLDETASGGCVVVD